MNWSSCSALTTAGSTSVMSPTKPISMGSAGCPVGHQLLLGLDQSAVLAGQAHGLAADFVDHHDDVLLDLAAQHPFDDFHGLGVGDAHALDEGALLADAAQRVIDLRTAAVDHHGVQADQLEQHHVVREAALQPLFRHGVAAVLHHDGLAVKSSNVRQGLGQHGGFDGGRRDGSRVGVSVMAAKSVNR